MTNYTLGTTNVGNSTFYIQFHETQSQENTPPVAQDMTNVFNTSEASAVLTKGASALAGPGTALQAHIQQISTTSASAMPIAAGFMVSSHQHPVDAGSAMEVDVAKEKRDMLSESQEPAKEEPAAAQSRTKRRRMENKIKITFDNEPPRLSNAEKLAANLEKVSAQLHSGEHPELFLGGNISRFHDIPAMAATCVDSTLNANLMTIEGRPVAIASQFPKDSQLEGQLRMYRDNVKVVLVLTPPDEMKKGRAGPMTDYFSTSGQFGDIRTESTAQDQLKLPGGLVCNVYHLEIYDGGREMKKIAVLHAQNWPDRTAAGEKDIQALVKALPEYKKGVEGGTETQASATVLPENEKDFAVHCTAGVGRTGVVLAAYIMEHPAFTHLSLEEVITLLREQRNGHMVQTQEQLQVLIDIANAQGRPLLKSPN